MTSEGELMKRIILLVIILIINSSFAHAKESAELRGQFIDAYANIKKGKKVKISHLKKYPLYPYLEYEILNRKLSSASDKQLLDFISKHENTLLADKLWRVWIKRLAKAKKWDDIKKNYTPIAATVETRCHYLEALIHTDEEKLALLRAEKLWMSATSRPKGCNPLFNELKKRNLLNKDKYWERIQLAVNKGKTKLARGLVKHLPADEQKIAGQLIASHSNPQGALKSKHIGKGRYSRKVIVHAIKRIARKNSKKGQKLWKSYQRNLTFSKEEKANVNSYLTVRAALNHDTGALKTFAKIPAELRSDDANKWMARMALRDGNWEKLHNAIDAMSDELSAKDIWRYWKARASAETGKKVAANEIYDSLAGNATFYGFLSADHLGKDYTVLEETDIDWENCAKEARKIGAIRRSLEWFHIGKNRNANKEWFWALKHLNKKGVLSAAALALEEERTILAVRTVAKTQDWNQVSLRFPLLYSKLIKQMSDENKVNPAWVYGIMRRESIFNTKAVSSARAVGLMQILPSTARGIAKNLGLNTVNKHDLLTPSINVKLGSAYLSSMLKDFKGSYVKATAGYNAGPGRSVKWTPKGTTIEADRWVESIPFNETRKYVRAVMAYTTIYDAKLTKGKGKRISDRLPPVSSKKRKK